MKPESGLQKFGRGKTVGKGKKYLAVKSNKGSSTSKKSILTVRKDAIGESSQEESDNSYSDLMDNEVLSATSKKKNKFDTD